MSPAVQNKRFLGAVLPVSPAGEKTRRKAAERPSPGDRQRRRSTRPALRAPDEARRPERKEVPEFRCRTGRCQRKRPATPRCNAKECSPGGSRWVMSQIARNPAKTRSWSSGDRSLVLLVCLVAPEAKFRIVCRCI